MEVAILPTGGAGFIWSLVDVGDVVDAAVPVVSIVIPCYEQAAYLPDAVDSVIAQTFTDWELVIVDDGSLDDTGAVAAALIADNPDRRIRLVRQANGGVSSARNAGISVSKGRYVLPLDADDVVEPNMLAATVRLLESRREIGIAYTDLRTFGAADTVFRTPEFNAFTLPAANEFAYCSLYRREIWEAVGGYNPNMVHGNEDWDFWIGAVECGYRAARVPELLFAYRLRPGTRSSLALEHDAMLRRQLRANHPRLYRPWLRLARWSLRLAGRVRRLLRRLS